MGMITATSKLISTLLFTKVQGRRGGWGGGGVGVKYGGAFIHIETTIWFHLNLYETELRIFYGIYFLWKYKRH